MAFPLAKVLFLTALLAQAVGTRQTQGGTVIGVLRTSAGMPLEGVRVAVEPVDNSLGAGVLESIGLTDKEGRFLLENVSPGRYHLVFGRLNSPVYHPGVTKMSEASTIVVVAGGTTTVPEMVSRTASVSGTVVDIKTERGRRVQSLILCCESDWTTPSSPQSFFLTTLILPVRPITATVRDDGTFSFPAVIPGDYYLHAVDPAIVSAAQPITVGREDLKNFEMKVTDGVRLEGRIVDRLKQPVALVNVTLKAKPGNAMIEGKGAPVSSGRAVFTVGQAIVMTNTLVPQIVMEQRVRMVTATPEGTFSFSGVLPGKYTLEMNAPGGNAFSKDVEVGIHESLNTELDVPFTLLAGRIVVNDASPVPKLAGSVRFVSMDPTGRILFGFPDDAGRFAVLMSSGEYRIFTDGLNVDRDIETISDGSTDLQSRRFVFDDSRRQEIRITIAP